MSAIGADATLSVFVLFCRIGPCLMLMPGVSGPRIPVRVRLFLALAITLGLAPLLSAKAGADLAREPPLALLRIIVGESLTGGFIGLLGRVFFAALETMANVIAMAIGLSSPLAPSAGDDEPLPAVAALISLGATVAFFLADLHFEVLRGLVASYAALPVGGALDPQFGLVQIADCLARAFALALQISSPFIVFALIVNFAIGLAAKFTPQIPIYFIAVPAVATGGLFLLYLTARRLLELFTAGFASFLATG